MWRFLHPQLPKIIIARREECKSCIVPVFWHADDLVADMATLNINDNTSDFAKNGSRTENLIGYKLSSARFGLSIRPLGFVFWRMGIVQETCIWMRDMRDIGTFGPLVRIQNE